VPSRIESFVAGIDLRSDARVPEVGCGDEIAATLICRQLIGGRYTAIDRSAKMIHAAQARNHAFIAQGRTEFLVGDLETVDLGDRRFDVALGIRVRLFRTDPACAEALVRRWLVPHACSCSTTCRDAGRPAVALLDAWLGLVMSTFGSLHWRINLQTRRDAELCPP
jgi:hypothetical protein